MVTWMNTSQEGEFTTWMTTNPPSPQQNILQIPNGQSRRRLPEMQYPEDVNQPYVTAKVNVYHCPAKNPAASRYHAQA